MLHCSRRDWAKTQHHHILVSRQTQKRERFLIFTWYHWSVILQHRRETTRGTKLGRGKTQHHQFASKPQRNDKEERIFYNIDVSLVSEQPQQRIEQQDPNVRIHIRLLLLLMDHNNLPEVQVRNNGFHWTTTDMPVSVRGRRKSPTDAVALSYSSNCSVPSDDTIRSPGLENHSLSVSTPPSPDDHCLSLPPSFLAANYHTILLDANDTHVIQRLLSTFSIPSSLVFVLSLAILC